MPLPSEYDVPSTTTRVATIAGARSDEAKKSYEPDNPVSLKDQSPLTGVAIPLP